MKEHEHKTGLLLRYLDGSLSDDEIETVEELLAQDADARAILRSIAEQAVVIADDSRVTAATTLHPRAAIGQDEYSKIEKKKIRFLRELLVIAAMIIIALSTGLVYQLIQTENKSGDPENIAKQDQVSDPSIARITGVSGGLIWTGDRGQIVRNITVGTKLAGGTIEGLAPDSWFELQFRDGSSVTISGASLLTFADLGQKELRLREGRLSAKVEPQPAGKPMLIRTRSALLKVLGTQLDVEADLASTVLTVSEGKVNFKRLSDGSEVDVLAKHQVTTDTDKDLSPALTPDSVHQWKSQLSQKPGSYGKWQAGTKNAPASMKAIPLIPPNAPQMTIHVAGLSVDRPDGSPVVLLPNTKFVVRGRLRTEATEARVYFGIRVSYPNGEFAGMFRGDLHHKQPLATKDKFGRFEEVYNLQQFTLDPSVRDRQYELAAKPDGLILEGVWGFTHTGSPSGLEITEVEVIPPEREKTRNDNNSPAQNKK